MTVLYRWVSMGVARCSAKSSLNQSGFNCPVWSRPEPFARKPEKLPFLPTSPNTPIGFIQSTEDNVETSQNLKAEFKTE